MTRVLLVEDDKNLCFILKSSLEQMIGGYEVETAANGEEGLKRLVEGKFDVIVSDVEMPVMDGMTMVRHIREHHPQVAIIFITGLTTARDVINGYQSGADFYIKKPFLPEELDAHIATSSTVINPARTFTSRSRSCRRSWTPISKPC